MRSEQLEYLLEVAKTGSFHKTAAKYYTSHQTVSTAIRNLENEVNAQLVIRDNQGTHLTASGEIMARYAEKILVTITQCKNEIATSSTSSTTFIQGTLTVLVSPLLNNFVIPDLILRFTIDFPHVKLRFLELESDEILPALTNRTADLGLFTIPRSMSNNNAISLLQNKQGTPTKFQLFAVVSPEHPLAKCKSTTLQTMHKYPLAIYQTGNNPNPVCSLFTQFGNVKIHLTTDNLLILRQSINSAQLLGILPKLENSNNIEALKPFKDLVWIPIKNYEPNPIGFAIAPNQSKNTQKLCQLFLETLQDIL